MKISKSKSKIPKFFYGLLGIGIYYIGVGLVGVMLFGLELSAGIEFREIDTSTERIIFIGSLILIGLLISEIVFWSKFFFGKKDSSIESVNAKMILGIIVSTSLIYLVLISWEIIKEGLLVSLR